MTRARSSAFAIAGSLLALGALARHALGPEAPGATAATAAQAAPARGEYRFVSVPAGRYSLGFAGHARNPAHVASLVAFEIADAETTNALGAGDDSHQDDQREIDGGVPSPVAPLLSEEPLNQSRESKGSRRLHEQRGTRV